MTRRDEVINFRTSGVEAERLRREAKVAGVGLSEWMRRQVLGRESNGAPWRGRWSWVAMHPQRVGGTELGPRAMPWGHVYFDDEGLDLLGRLAEVAWHSCGYCYGTGYRGHKTYRPGDPHPGDCPECDGWGVVQAVVWRQRQEQKSA